MENKPAKSAAEYLAAEDTRLLEEIIKVMQVLKQGLCPIIHRSLSYPLYQEARKQYREKEKEAALYWGQHEIAEVRSMRRKDANYGYIGDFR